MLQASSSPMNCHSKVRVEIRFWSTRFLVFTGLDFKIKILLNKICHRQIYLFIVEVCVISLYMNIY